MATLVSRVSAYRIALLPPSRQPGTSSEALITCDAEGGHLVQIRFYSGGAAGPAPIIEALVPDNPDFADVFFVEIGAPSAQFVWYLDLLRNENPYVKIFSGNAAQGLPSACWLNAEWAAASWGHFG
jgi:hypothetical protein